MKKLIYIVLGLLALYVTYRILGYYDIIPMYHCDTAMGPQGLVRFCEWYKGSRVY